MHKTIADVTVEVLKETDNDGVMFGDVILLDMIADRCKHTTLIRKKDGSTTHPLARHSRILNALEGDSRFKKHFVRLDGMRGNQMWRCFKLNEA